MTRHFAKVWLLGMAISIVATAMMTFIEGGSWSAWAVSVAVVAGFTWLVWFIIQLAGPWIMR